MFAALPRRSFLSGLSVLGVAACAAHPSSSGRLGHRVVGDGSETVVVLHEWMGDHSNYDGALPYLGGAGARYVFADLRGYGLSRGMTGSYCMAEAAGDVVALMDHLGADRFHVVGHSMSGQIAQYLAVQWPARVRSVVAISPVPASGFKANAGAMAKLRAVVSDDDTLRAAVEARTGGRYGRAWLDRKLALARRADPAAMLGYLDMFTGTDFASRMTGLPMPATLIVGAHDIPFYGRAALEPAFARAFARVDTVVDAEAGHYSMVETPVLLAALVERAVQAASAGPSDHASQNGRAVLSSTRATAQLRG